MLPNGVFDEQIEKVWHSAGKATNLVYVLPRGDFFINFLSLGIW